MKIEFCDLNRQYELIKNRIKANIDEVLTGGKYVMGPQIAELETILANFSGVKHGIACANGTDALTLAVMALDIEPGEEVIMPAFTYFATAEACSILGIKPIFVDIDQKTCNIDPTLIEAKITPKTRAIMHVSLYGQCGEIKELQAIARKHSIALIEDAAQSFGALHKGKRSCSFSDISCTSFFPSKPLGCYGDGGMCFTNDDGLAEKLRKLRFHGQEVRYRHDLIGMNSRLDTLQAAILLAKFEVFEEEIKLRNKVAKYYNELHQHFKPVVVSPDNLSVYAQYTLRALDSFHRQEIIDEMHKKGIPIMIHYPILLPAQPAYAVVKSERKISREAFSDKAIKNNMDSLTADFPVAWGVANTVFSLPMHPYLTQDEQDYIIENLIALA